MPFAQSAGTEVPVHVLSPDAVEAWLGEQDDFTRAFLSAQPFDGKVGSVSVIPGPDGAVRCVLAGWGSDRDRRRDWFPLGGLRGRLPAGTYRFAAGIDGADLERAALAWLLAGYRFDRYKAKAATKAELVAPDGVDAVRLEALAAGVALTQDLINTPAQDMGPDALEAAAGALATGTGGAMTVIRGEALQEQNFPMIHAVGRAAAREPRLLDLGWGDPSLPKVTLVGKGVCFDTGGLDIKPSSSMALMKKDMGGAATVLGLASMLRALDAPVRLRVLIPAVENAISGSSFRPGDVLTSRKGLTVEINNTDAEGRLVLADALTLADEESPDLMVCMATLTGAARVALGPDMPPYYTDDEALAAEIAASADRAADPLWRLPFWTPYDAMIEPDIADLDNAPAGGFAGSITAALFLRRFVERAASFVHLDIFGWTPAAKPARPKGAACQGARALLEVIEGRYGRGRA